MRFEEIVVGQEIGPLAKGQMTAAHIMRWSAAIENWHRIHYDQPYALQHEKLPGILVNGSWKQHVLVQLFKEAFGHEAWLWRIKFRYKAPDLAGDSITAAGRIIETRVVDGLGFALVEVWLAKQDGSVTTEGHGWVALPLPGGSAVPYPFRPTAGHLALTLP